MTGQLAMIALLSSTWALGATNTNECISDLGAIQVCQQTNWLGLPSNLGACCDAVREMARDRCECNPALDLLLGEEGQQIYELEPLCRIVQPFKWLTTVPRVLRSCNSLKRHDYGCGPNDMQMDAARLQTILTFGHLFADAANEQACFDTPAFEGGLSTVFESDISFTVPYGIGTYNGVTDVAEYLGMAYASLNHGYWNYDTTIDPSKPARLDVTANGRVWVQGSTFRGSFLRGLLPYSDSYSEQRAEFQACETKVSTFNVQPTTGVRDWVETFVQTAERSERWGVRDICRYHTQFCAGDPATRQYASEQDCLDYMNTLPLYSQACGPNRPLAGNSVTCKFKHHFMVAANPTLHCPHIGPAGTHDPNHHIKCDDVEECGADQGQGSWPAVTRFGPNTPAAVASIFNASNVNAAQEPIACVIPSTGSGGGHHH